jgi:hypothetical protein
MKDQPAAWPYCILSQFVTQSVIRSWHNSASRKFRGLPIMQTVLDQPNAKLDARFRPHGVEEERELALLTQFMRHDSVASLANAIAEPLGGGVRGGDLIVAAGLSFNGGPSCGLSCRVPVNPRAGLRR